MVVYANYTHKVGLLIHECASRCQSKLACSSEHVCSASKERWSVSPSKAVTSEDRKVHGKELTGF
jgi:hypothetical protein|eukprot:COSAG06_NODE_2750_length_6346_cov_22.249080_6_plen_65_part_00